MLACLLKPLQLGLSTPTRPNTVIPAAASAVSRSWPKNYIAGGCDQTATEHKGLTGESTWMLRTPYFNSSMGLVEEIEATGEQFLLVTMEWFGHATGTFNTSVCRYIRK